MERIPSLRPWLKGNRTWFRFFSLFRSAVNGRREKGEGRKEREEAALYLPRFYLAYKFAHCCFYSKVPATELEEEGGIVSWWRGACNASFLFTILFSLSFFLFVPAVWLRVHTCNNTMLRGEERKREGERRRRGRKKEKKKKEKRKRNKAGRSCFHAVLHSPGN